MTSQTRYNLHYKLRKAGNRVDTWRRGVIKRTQEVSANETRWLDRLNKAGYGISDDMFY